jgi:AraC-like DNA-binding protein
MRYLGVDLHKTHVVGCFLTLRGQPRVVTYPLTEEGLRTFRRQLRADDEGAVEVGQNTYYFHEQIQDRVKRVGLVDPYRFAVVSRSKKRPIGMTPSCWRDFSHWAGCRPSPIPLPRCGSCGPCSRRGRRSWG